MKGFVSSSSAATVNEPGKRFEHASGQMRIQHAIDQSRRQPNLCLPSMYDRLLSAMTAIA